LITNLKCRARRPAKQLSDPNLRIADTDNDPRTLERRRADPRRRDLSARAG